MLGNGATQGTQCWCLLLAGWALSSGQSQVGLDEEKFMLCTTSILATMAILFLSQLGDNVKESESHGTGHLIHLAIKTLLCRGHPLVTIHMKHKYLLHGLPIHRGLFTYVFPKRPCHKFSNHVSSKSLVHPAKRLATVYELTDKHTAGRFSSPSK